MPGERLKELAERIRELNEEARRNPGQIQAIEQQKRIVRSAIRNLPASEFADASFAPLHRQNYTPERRVGTGWAMVGFIGTVFVLVAMWLGFAGFWS